MKNNNEIQQALNTALSSLHVSDTEAGMLLAQAKGGKKVKKKLSVAFVLMMIFVTLSLTALAVITIREVGRQVAENEKKQGYYINWTLEQKKKLIGSLIELKYMDESEEAGALLNGIQSDQEASETANRLMEKYTNRNIDEINFLTIMQVPMGSVDKWTYEEKAWYSKLMRDVGLEGDGITQFVEPSGKISEEEAIRIARREVAAGYKVDESKLDSYQVSVDFEIPEAAEPNDRQAYWHVKFAAPDDMPEDERLFILFPVYVHPETGDLMISVNEMLERRTNSPTRPDNEIYRTIESISQGAKYIPFRRWPLELKAKYSQMVNPLVERIVASGDMEQLTLNGKLDIETLARAEYTYGLPDKKAVSEAEAYEIAKKAVHNKFDVDDKVFPLYLDYIVYYDVTDAEQPLWKFVFNGWSLDWPKLEGGLNDPLNKVYYKVEILARNSEVKHVEEYSMDSLGKTLESELKWY